MILELEEFLEELSEASEHNGYLYSVKDILTIMICGLLCGLPTVKSIKQWSEVPRNKDFLTRYFGITKIPCVAQIYNILRTVNAPFFEECFINWMKLLIKKNVVGDVKGKTIAFDGKAIRSTGKVPESTSIMHIASAVISDSQLVLGSTKCKENMGEIDAVRYLIGLLDIKDAVVVTDALHCQRETAKIIIEAGAHYVMNVKKNQKNLRESIDLLAYNKKTDSHTTVEKNAGRIETRTAYLTNQIDNLYNKAEWQNVACVGVIKRTFEKGNNPPSEQTHYYISSKDMTAEELLHHARMEWQVEVMHWLLDVHFEEDKTRLWNKKVQQNFNLMRKIVLNLVKEYQKSLLKKTAQSEIMRANLFDVDSLETFVTHFE